MSLRVAGLTAGPIVLAALVTGFFYVQALHAELANTQQQRDDARQSVADREGALRRIQEDADKKARQQVQLTRTHSAIAARLNALQLSNRILTDENTALRAWAATRLPDVVVRVQANPTLTGADDYLAHMSGSEPLHTAGDGTADKR